MSVEIDFYPILSMFPLDDVNFAVKNASDTSDEDWLFFKGHPIFCLNDSRIAKDVVEHLVEFVEYIWVNYKCLIGLDGAGPRGDASYRLFMELHHCFDEDLIIDGRGIYDILAIEYFSYDTKIYLSKELADEVEHYRKENEPYYLKACAFKKVKEEYKEKLEDVVLDSDTFSNNDNLPF